MCPLLSPSPLLGSPPMRLLRPSSPCLFLCGQFRLGSKALDRANSGQLRQASPRPGPFWCAPSSRPTLRLCVLLLRLPARAFTTRCNIVASTAMCSLAAVPLYSPPGSSPIPRHMRVCGGVICSSSLLLIARSCQRFCALKPARCTPSV